MPIPGAIDNDPLLDTVLAQRYRIVARLGEGGMGTVYTAEHQTLRRPFAVKVLRRSLCENRRAVDRFLREAQAASSIAHDNVIEVIDTGFLPTGSAYYVMEYLRGEDLAATLRRERRLPWPRVRAIALQICDALAAAHAQGIVHRDLKPENCFRITRAGNPDFIKLLDFGIAKITAADANDQPHLTNTGEVIGTTPYMAPEQASGQRIDLRVDVYAVGVLLYQLLTGRLPYWGQNTLQILTAILTRNAPSMDEAAPDARIPPQLDALVARAMHRDLAERFSDMASLIAAIQTIPADLSPSPGMIDVTTSPNSPPPITLGLTELAADAVQTDQPTAPYAFDRTLATPPLAVATDPVQPHRGQSSPPSTTGPALTDPPSLTTLPSVTTAPPRRRGFFVGTLLATSTLAVVLALSRQGPSEPPSDAPVPSVAAPEIPPAPDPVPVAPPEPALEEPEPVSQPEPGKSPTAKPPPARSTPKKDPPAAKTSSATTVRRTIVKQVQKDCKDHYQAQLTLNISIRSDGVVEAVDGPLPASRFFVRCADTALRKLRFGPLAKGFSESVIIPPP